MCLQVNEDQTTPYSASKIRWKFLKVVNGKLRSYHKRVVWNVDSWKRATDQGFQSDPTDIGIHCFMSMRDAKQSARQHGCFTRTNLVLAKLEVRRFNAAGTYTSTCAIHNCETWREARLIDVFTRGGRKITHRFKKKR